MGAMIHVFDLVIVRLSRPCAMMDEASTRATPSIRTRGRRRIEMSVNPRAGEPADPAMLVNVPRLITAYYEERPDPAVPAERVVFGTSGHRGSAFDRAFNEWHIL